MGNSLALHDDWLHALSVSVQGLRGREGRGEQEKGDWGGWGEVGVS